MENISKKALASGIAILSLLLASTMIVVLFPGTPGSKHIGGVINMGLSFGFVFLVSLLDPRWSLYEQIIEENNIAAGIVLGMVIIASAIATPSSIL